MTHEDQDGLIADLEAALYESGNVTEEGIKTLFAKKNELEQAPEGTSGEFDEFFADTILDWAGEKLDESKSALLISLIDPSKESFDDSEDAVIGAIADEFNAEEMQVDESFIEAFSEYFE